MGIQLLIATLFRVMRPKVTVRFLTAVLFCLLSFLLLQKENKEVYSFKTVDLISIDRTIPESYKWDLAGGNDKKTNATDSEVLFCLPLKKIFGNKSELDLVRIRDVLVEYFNRTFYESTNDQPSTNLESNSSKIDELTISNSVVILESKILNQIKSRKYYIVRNRFCLILDAHYPSRMVLDRLFENPEYFLRARGTWSVIQLQLQPGWNIDLNKVSQEGNPNFDCSSYTKFQCLAECFKERAKFSKYFYRGEEKGTIQLQYEDEPVIEHERSCFSRCEDKPCLHVEQNRLRKAEGNGSNEFISVHTIKQVPSISTLSYWVQVAGLCLTFFGTCVYKLAFKPFKLFVNENQIKAVACCCCLFKILITLLCLTAFCVTYLYIERDYFQRSRYKNEFWYKRQPEMDRFGLVVCVPVLQAMNNYSYYTQLRNFSSSSISSSSNLISFSDLKITQMTFAELEADTNLAFNETFIEMYSKILNKPSAISYSLLDKVLFMNDKEVGDSFQFSRCFHIAVNISQPRYQSFLAQPELTILFKHSFYSLYLLPDEENFHSDSYRHDKMMRFQKIISKYGVEHPSSYDKPNSSCNSRADCLDQCVNEEAMRQKRNISVFGVIDKDRFTNDQWSTVFPDFSIDYYRELVAKCHKQVKKEWSRVGYSSWGLQIFQSPELISVNEMQRKLQLSSEIRHEHSNKLPALKLALNLLNIQLIFFDLNLRRILIAALFFFKVKQLKRTNLILFPIYLICAAGFLFHIKMIFNQLFDDEPLVSNEIKEKQFSEMPELLFCFDLPISVDSSNRSDEPLSDLFGQTRTNQELTGNHLENATRELNVERVFRTISYLNNESRWEVLDQSNFTTNEMIRINSVYLYGMKCFKLVNLIRYELRQFYFDSLEYEKFYSVMKVDFNRPFIEKQPPVLLTKAPNKTFLSEPTRYDPRQSLTIYLPAVSLINNDKFSFLKFDLFINPLSLFFSHDPDMHSYLTKLKSAFKQKHNATTLELPLEGDEFDLPIKDKLFQKFYEEVQYPKDKLLSANLIYERQIQEIRLMHENKSDSSTENPDMVFEISFNDWKQEFRNGENRAKLILNLLNSFTLWLGMDLFSKLNFRFERFSGRSIRKQIARFASSRVAPNEIQEIQE